MHFNNEAKGFDLKVRLGVGVRVRVRALRFTINLNIMGPPFPSLEVILLGWFAAISSWFQLSTMHPCWWMGLMRALGMSVATCVLVLDTWGWFQFLAPRVLKKHERGCVLCYCISWSMQLCAPCY